MKYLLLESWNLICLRLMAVRRRTLFDHRMFLRLKQVSDNRLLNWPANNNNNNDNQKFFYCFKREFSRLLKKQKFCYYKFWTHIKPEFILSLNSYWAFFWSWQKAFHENVKKYHLRSLWKKGSHNLWPAYAPTSLLPVNSIPCMHPTIYILE